MNKTHLKKLLLLTLFGLSLQNSTIIASKELPETKETVTDTKNLENNSESLTPQEQAAFSQFIDNAFEHVKAQTETLKFCLQEIEVIVNAGKIKFEHKKISKAEFLREIQQIKNIIASIDEFYTTQLPKGDGMIHGACFNLIITEYLLTTISQDIIKLKVKDFDQHIATKTRNFEKIITELKSLEQITDMIEQNQKQIKKLHVICENIGLTILNKFYRYLETQALPIIGKPTIAALQDCLLWGGSAFFAYTIATYFAPRNAEIYGTWTEYKPTEETKTAEETKNAESKSNKKLDLKDEPAVLNMNRKDLVHAAAEGAMLVQKEMFLAAQKEEKEKEKPYTWYGNDGKLYRRKTVKEFLPLKSFLGELNDVGRVDLPLPANELKKIYDDFGLYSYIDYGIRKATNPFIGGSLALLGYFTKESLQELSKNIKIGTEKFINYSLRGETTPLKNSNEVAKAYFTDMIGGQHLERLAYELVDYLKNPLRYERQGIPPSTGYLLVGPSQTGKSYFAKALKTLIDKEFADQNQNVKFFSITADDIEWYGGFARIFNLARKDAPCILFIDELDMYGARRENSRKNTQDLLTSINGLETDPTKKVIVIAATNRPEELDFALLEKGRFSTIINFDYPTYECRKAYLEKQLRKNNIKLDQNMIETIAQETNNHTYNMIEDIVRQALRLATYETRVVCEKDFEITLDREIRKIQPTVQLSQEEKEIIAIYQAGQAAARHILQTEQQVVKITVNAVDKPIKPKEGIGIITEEKGQQHENLDLLPQHRTKNTRLGYVFTMSKSNNPDLIDDANQEKEILALIAGNAALEILTKKTFTEFGKEDRAKVLEMLEKKISQGSPITNKIRAQAIEKKNALYEKVKTLLQKHISFVKTIQDALVTQTTLDKKQWEKLTANYTIQ